MYFQDAEQPLDSGMGRANRSVLMISLAVIVFFVFIIGPLREHASLAVAGFAQF